MVMCFATLSFLFLFFAAHRDEVPLLVQAVGVGGEPRGVGVHRVQEHLDLANSTLRAATPAN